MHLRPAQLYQGFRYLHFHRVSPAASSLNTMMSDSKSKQYQKTDFIQRAGSDDLQQVLRNRWAVGGDYSAASRSSFLIFYFSYND